MQDILKYFPHLTPRQTEQFAALDGLYRDWNAKINVISRKDIDNLYPTTCSTPWPLPGPSFQARHPHPRLRYGRRLPRIPLAILFPNAASDSSTARARKSSGHRGGTGHRPAERRDPAPQGREEKDRFDFVVSRAVMPLPDLVKIVRKNILRQSHNALPNGLIVLKGGNLTDELKPFGKWWRSRPSPRYSRRSGSTTSRWSTFPCNFLIAHHGTNTPIPQC